MGGCLPASPAGRPWVARAPCRTSRSGPSGRIARAARQRRKARYRHSRKKALRARRRRWYRSRQPPGDQPPGDQPPGDQPPGDRMKPFSALRSATLGPWRAAALAFFACLAAASAGAAPDSRSSFDGYAFPSWLGGATSCGEGFERSAPDGWRRLSGRLGGAAARATAEFAKARGRALFGPDFRLVDNALRSPCGDGLGGNADPIVPPTA